MNDAATTPEPAKRQSLLYRSNFAKVFVLIASWWAIGSTVVEHGLWRLAVGTLAVGLVPFGLFVLSDSILRIIPAAQQGGYKTADSSVYAVMGLGSIVFGFIAYSIGAFVLDQAQTLYLGVKTGDGSQVSVASVGVLVVGLVFFSFRTKFRGLYGLSEVVFGMWVAGTKVADVHAVTQEVFLSLLTAGVYLVVRGLDNMREARDKRSDPIFERWVFRRAAAEAPVDASGEVAPEAVAKAS